MSRGRTIKTNATLIKMWRRAEVGCAQFQLSNTFLEEPVEPVECSSQNGQLQATRSVRSQNIIRDVRCASCPPAPCQLRVPCCFGSVVVFCLILAGSRLPLRPGVFFSLGSCLLQVFARVRAPGAWRAWAGTGLAAPPSWVASVLRCDVRAKRVDRGPLKVSEWGPAHP